MTMPLPRIPIVDLCLTVTSGGTPSRKEPSFWDSGTIPWVKTGELSDWKITKTAELITPQGLARSSAKVFAPGTVLMAMYGDGRTITTLGIVDTPCSSNQACCAFVTNPRICDSLYLFYALRFHRKELLNLVVAGAQRNLSISILKRFTVFYQPIERQLKISSILSAYDHLIENNARRMQALEANLQSLFDQTYVATETRSYRLGELLSSLESGSRPRGGVSSEGEIPSIGAENVNGLAKHDFAKEKRISRAFFTAMKRGVVQNGDVLLYKDGAHIGRTALAWSGYPHKECAVNEHVFLLRPRSSIPSAFLYFYLARAEVKERVRLLNTNSAQPGLNQAQVLGVRVEMPAPGKLSEFEQVAKPMLDLIFTLAKQQVTLRAARDLLLPKLISGEIDVGVAEEALEAVAE